MTAFQILSADEARIAGLEYPDFYFTDGYGLASEASDNADWLVAVWDKGKIIYPFLKRAVPGQSALFDITSPYGYSGVWGAESVSKDDWRAFREACKQHFRDHGIVAEFLRLSGLVPGRMRLLAEDQSIIAREHNQTLVISTKDGYQACWDRFESRARTKVRKARKNGIQSRWFKASPADVAASSVFRTLYEGTMARIGASEYYFFPDEYYAALAKHLDLNMLEMTKNGDVIASAMVLPCGQICHLHLVGTSEGANRLGVSNFLYDETCRWAAENSCNMLHIGGGLKPDDSLFYFKKGFGGRPISFMVGQTIHDAKIYDSLVAAHADALNVSPQILLETGYFPAYRATLADDREASL